MRVQEGIERSQIFVVGEEVGERLGLLREREMND